MSRRQLLWGSAAFSVLLPGQALSAGQPTGVTLGSETDFSFDVLRQRARDTAAQPWQAPAKVANEVLAKIDYDAYQQIRFRSDATLQLGEDGQCPIQLFHLGNYFREPVRIHLVEKGRAREVEYRTALFNLPAGHPALELPNDIGFAGFRIMGPELNTDWLAFLGASYFRTSGPFDQYGLSARGLAIDTGLTRAEEFPRFTEFWLARDDISQPQCTIYALLDSPSVSGAYRISTVKRDIKGRGSRIVMEIEADLTARRDVERLGIAPFSSMFWYGEASRARTADWRPEIHDSDGLAIHTGAGERIWRPLNNPPTVMTNTFVDRDIKGFGLLQRDRDFVHYLDDGVFYERRPSVWVEPLDAWGEGAVHLLEIPTDDEIHDNIAAYWCPAEPFKAGQNRSYRYRLSWLDEINFPAYLGRATATLTGRGGRPGYRRPDGLRKFVIDFQGTVFDGIGREDGVEIVATPSRGTISNAYTHPVVDQRNRWRALFDLEVTGAQPVDLRAYLRRGDRALTETWIFQYFPEQGA